MHFNILFFIGIFRDFRSLSCLYHIYFKIMENENENENDLIKSDPRKILISKKILFMKINKKYHDYYPLISKFDVISTRFTTDTYIQLYRYKEQNKLTYNSLYGVNYHMSHNIDKYTYLFILEMNNTINKIMGVGLISNVAIEKNHQIFHNELFNNYIYGSSYHIQLINPDTICNYNTRSLNKIDHRTIYCDTINEEFIEFFENIIIPRCFYGKSHLKRGGGFTRFPMKYLQPEVMQMFVKLFIYSNPNNFNDKIIKKLLSQPDES